MKKQFYIIILLFVTFLSVSAQEATLVPQATPIGIFGIAVVKGNDVYIDQNSTLTIDATLSQNLGTNVSIRIIVSNEKGESALLEFSSQENIPITSNNDFSKFFTKLGQGDITISGSYKVGIEDSWHDFTNALKVHVYESVSLESNPSEDEEPLIIVVGDSAQKVTFSLDIEGGNDSGWFYQWRREAKMIENETESSYTFLCNNTNQSGEYSVSIINKAEDGTTLFDSHIIVCNLKVYKLNLTNEPNNTEIVSSSNTKVHFKLDLEGEQQNEEWSYQWYYGKEMKSDIGKEWDYIPEAPSDSIRKDTIRVLAKWKGNSYECSKILNVYHAISIDLYGLEYVLNEVGERALLEGETFQLGFRKKGGIGVLEDKDHWSVEWYDNGKKITSSDIIVNQFTAENSQKSGTVKPEQHSYYVKVTNKANGQDVCNVSSNPLVVYVYPIPRFEANYNQDTIIINTCKNSNQPIDLKTHLWGGYPSGWKYKWTCDDSELPQEKDNYISPSNLLNDTDKPVKHIYKLYSTNSIGSIVKYENIETFLVNVWPAINYNVNYKSISGSGQLNDTTLVNIFVGDSIEYEFSLAGGNPEGWKIDLSPSEHVEVVSPDKKHYFLIAKKGVASGSYEESSEIRMRNVYQGETWLDTKINLRYKVFNRGYIDKTLHTDSFNIYMFGKEYHTLKVTTYEGYTGSDAWKFVWNNTIEGKETKQDFTSSPIYNVNLPDINTMTKMTCQVICTNNIQSHVGSRDTSNILTLYLWPVANFGKVNVNGKNGESTVTCIRNGANLTFDCRASGAYEPENYKTWNYDWYFGGQQEGGRDYSYFECNTERTFIGEGMETYTQDCHVVVTNFGPSGNIWAQKTRDIPIKIYRAPRTPVQLKRKGNGRSNTFVIMFPDGVTDEILTQNDYHYVFGYTDASGNDHDLATIDTRYYHVDNSSDFNDTSRKYYVYSLWNYPDGARVTSNKRILNSTEEYFDGSIFDMETRSDMTTVSPCLLEQTDISGNHVKAHFDKPVKVTVTVYSVRGDLIKRQILGLKNVYNERIILDNLTSGIYLLHYAIGTQVKVEKVVVK